MRRHIMTMTAALVTMFVMPSHAQAIPVFAHRYGFSCQQCHTTIPHLNGFGLRFFRNGFRLPGMPAKENIEFPVALAGSFAYTSEPDPTGLPKAIVDEIELLSGGSYGHLSYFTDFYVVNGGTPGSPRDVWASYWGTPSSSGNVLRFKAGEMTLPVPVDPETFRETQNHYAIFDQRVGGNPFAFYDVHSGGEIAFGNPNRGVNAHVLLLRPHDPLSLLPEHGTDTMGTLQWLMPDATLSVYRYGGTRVIGGANDAFTRYGVGFWGETGRFSVDLLFQNGADTNANGMGTFARGSGGFAQLRWAFSRGLTGIVRYDGTSDTLGGFLREMTFSLNTRVTRNTRLTVEDVITHGPTKNTLNVGFFYAY